LDFFKFVTLPLLGVPVIVEVFTELTIFIDVLI